MASVLIAGVMRAGKTSLATALCALEGVVCVEEPDNHLGRRPFAFRVKRRLGLGNYPALDPDLEYPEYELLWRNAFGLDPRAARSFSPRERIRRALALGLYRRRPRTLLPPARSPATRLPPRLRAVEALAVPERPRPEAGHVVVTANAPLSVEWIAARTRAAVVVVFRDPLEVLASWAELGWLGSRGDDMLDELDPRAAGEGAARLGLTVPERGSSPLTRAAWLLGFLVRHLEDAAARHPDWYVVSYEDLCERPREQVRALAETLGLAWSGDADRILVPRPPRGATRRFTPEEEREVGSVLAGFRLRRRRPTTRAELERA